MVGKVRPGARIVGLLGLPRYDPAFDVDFPRAGARAIHAMRGAHDLVCGPARSEEHTSELQSLMRISYAVFCLKKKNKEKQTIIVMTCKHTTTQQRSVQS